MVKYTYCLYSQTIVLVSTVTTQLSLLDRLPTLPLNVQNAPVFIQTEASNLKYNQLIDTF